MHRKHSDRVAFCELCERMSHRPSNFEWPPWCVQVGSECYLEAAVYRRNYLATNWLSIARDWLVDRERFLVGDCVFLYFYGRQDIRDAGEGHRGQGTCWYRNLVVRKCRCRNLVVRTLGMWLQMNWRSHCSFLIQIYKTIFVWN